ncbi:MAG: hypothetical protein C0396_00345 [Anaerolinea sp.]|nr:hypothetical protein [Anaerolinea sp.]
MLAILPLALLVTTALAVYILRYLPRGTGYAWLTAVLMALITWGGVLALNWYEPQELVITPWRPFDPENADAIRLGWDSIAWMYAFSLISAELAVLMTAAARLRLNSNPATWAANLFIAAAGIAAVLAQTPLALLLAWVILDVLDLLVVMRLSSGWKYTSSGVMAFVVRTISSFMLISALAIQRVDGGPLTFDTMLPQASLLVFLSIGLRLGLLPLNTPYSEDIPLQRGLISFIRLAAHTAGLAALARFPQTGVPAAWQLPLYIVTVFAILHGSVMWLTARNEIQGRPYWLLVLSGLSFICVLQGQPLASLAWGLVMVTSGMGLFLYSARTRGLIFLPLLGALALTGLPFTPAASGWAGLVTIPLNMGELIIILSIAMLLVGYVRHGTRLAEDFNELDGWVRGIYPFGLVLVVLSGWLAAVFGLPGGINARQWLPAILTTALAATIGVISWWFASGGMAFLSANTWPVKLLRGAGQFLAQSHRLSWFYDFLWLIYRGLRQLVRFATVLFEGEGGMMWAFVLLALLITLLSGRGVF